MPGPVLSSFSKAVNLQQCDEGTLRMRIEHPKADGHVDGDERGHPSPDRNLSVQRRVDGRVQHPPEVPQLRVVVPHPLLPLLDHGGAPAQLGARDEQRAGIEDVEEVAHAACGDGGSVEGSGVGSGKG